jgi:uncharacterized protein
MKKPYSRGAADPLAVARGSVLAIARTEPRPQEADPTCATHRVLLLAAVIALLALPAWSLDTKKLQPTGYVNDFANTLDAASKQSLEAYCANLERVTGVQMAIVLVPSLDGEPVEDVANRLYREWGIGKKGKDEGILILLSVQDRKSRAEIGYGIEPIISDGAAGGILRQIRPILQQGNYGGALLAGAEQMGTTIAQSKGVELGGPEPARRTRQIARGPSIPFPLILIGLFFLLWLMGRGGSGGGTGLLAGMLLGNMMGGRGGWGGGGFGGYSGGGGGGGGFGGFGGGDSGGGGASGGW